MGAWRCFSQTFCWIIGPRTVHRNLRLKHTQFFSIFEDSFKHPAFIVHCMITCFYTWLGVHAVGLINEAVDKGDPAGTLEALKLPSAQLKNVDGKQALHYQTLLADKKKQRQEVGFILLYIHVFYVILSFQWTFGRRNIMFELSHLFG